MFGWRNDVLILYFVVKNNHLLKVIMLIPFTDHNSPVRSGDLAPPPNFLTSGFFLKIFVGKSKSYDSFTNYISCLALALNSTMCTPSPLGEIGLKFIEVLNIIFLFLCLLSWNQQVLLHGFIWGDHHGIKQKKQNLNHQQMIVSVHAFRLLEGEHNRSSKINRFHEKEEKKKREKLFQHINLQTYRPTNLPDVLEFLF